MTTRNDLRQFQFHRASLVKKMLLGAGIGFILIGLFLLGVDDPDPNWPKYWMLRPLIVVPIATAFGAAFYFFVNQVRYASGWKNLLLTIVGILGFLVSLWLGTVLGLDGTLWN